MANQIKETFTDWWEFKGDDELRLYNVLADIPYKSDVDNVAKSYRVLTGKNMIDDFRFKLDTEERKAATAIIESKRYKSNSSYPNQIPNVSPQDMARLLRASIGWEVTELIAKIPSQDYYWATVQAYQSIYNESLDDILQAKGRYSNRFPQNIINLHIKLFNQKPQTL